jgi:hypothetical protein
MRNLIFAMFAVLFALPVAAMNVVEIRSCEVPVANGSTSQTYQAGSFTETTTQRNRWICSGSGCYFNFWANAFA